MSESVVEVEGMLVKSPPHQRDIFGKLKRWRKRYCVLRRSKSRERGATLSYYETQEAYIYGTKSKGSIDIKDCIDVETQPSLFFGRDYIVSLRTKDDLPHKGRVFHFCAKNQVEQKQWVDAILKCMRMQTETDIERESPPPDHTEDPTIFTTDGPTALAETIRREKAKAGVERARSYEETGEIYEICSRDRCGSNNNEPPEELDSATAREHEEPCQATNEGNSDGKSNRRSSGYGSGSNRESDGPWNYPFDSRDAIYGAEEPTMKSPMHKNNLFHFNSDFTGPRFAQRKAQSMSNLLDIQQDAFSPERCHMSPIEQNTSIVEKLEIIISTRRRSSEPDDSNSKQRVAQQPQNTCVHCQQPRSGSDPNGMRPAKDKERKPTRRVSESAMQGLVNRNDCQHQCYADVFPTPQPPNRLLGNASEPSTQCDVRPRQSSNHKDKGSKQFRTRSRSTEERFRGPSENFDTSATIRPPSFCLNTRFFNITRQFSDIEEVGDGSRVGNEASSICQQPRSVSDATEKRPKQLTTACKSLSLD